MKVVYCLLVRFAFFVPLCYSQNPEGVVLRIDTIPIAQVAAQGNVSDSLIEELKKTSSDWVHFNIYNDLGDFFHSFSLFDSAMYFYERADEIAKRNDQSLLDALCVTKIAFCTMFSQGAVQAFDTIQKGFDLLEDRKIFNGKYWKFNKISPQILKLSVLGWLNWLMGHLQRDQLNNINESIRYFHQGRKLALSAKDSLLLGFCNGSIIYSFIRGNRPDSALTYGQAVEQIATYSINNDIFRYIRVRPDKEPFYLKDIGIAYLKMNNKPAFLKYLWMSIDFANEEGYRDPLSECYRTLTEYYLLEKDKDSSFYYAKKNQQYNSDTKVYENLYKAYELKNEPDSVSKYMKLTLSGLNESDEYQLETNKEIQRISFQKQLQLQALEKEKIKNEGKLKSFSIAALILVFSIIGFLLYRSGHRQRKARAIIEQSYRQLKATQSQLVQSEKMASLGELTAGIAHEIQNPLNFVNNFSDVNQELLAELKDEAGKGNLDEVKAIANNVIENEQKINHHGKRADAIVRGMLQHSRTSSGQKEPTDINKLADEYLRLVYQGFRAKDKSFNAEVKTNFDNSIGKINVVPQDIGRVILNLINNAFYAVNEKGKLQAAGYEPLVVVGTKKLYDKVEIRIKDNGIGITSKNLDKIFQPFFTTKPTGQGTGLGLSLSYDIIKSHGGELKVETKENEGAEFIIHMPAQ
jgi:signal transduction histidine kinase